jgi:hypothetical protein
MLDAGSNAAVPTDWLNQAAKAPAKVVKTRCRQPNPLLASEKRWNGF